MHIRSRDRLASVSPAVRCKSGRQPGANRNRWFNGGDTYIGLEWIPVTRLKFPINNLAKEENRLNILGKSDDGLPVTSIGYYVSPIALVKADPEYPTVVGFVSTDGQELKDVIG